MRDRGVRLLAGSILLIILSLSFAQSKAQRLSNDGQSGPIEIIPSTLGGWSKPAFTADGRLVVVGNGNGAQLWDLPKNRLVRTFTGLGSINTTVALSPDGTRIAAGAGKSINIWNIATGHVEATFTLLMGLINAISFSKDGTRLIYVGSTVGHQPKIVILDAASGQIIKTFYGEATVEALDVSTDGQLIAAGDISGIARIFDNNGRILRTLTHRSHGRIKDLSFSPDGRLIATGGDDGSAKIWDVATGKMLRSLPGHVGFLHTVLSLSWSADGSLLATTDSVDLRIWGTATGDLKAKRSFKDPSGKEAFISRVSFMPDGHSLLIDAMGIKRISVENQTIEAELGGVGFSEQFIRGVTISDGEIYFDGAYPRAIYSFDLSTRKVREVLKTADERAGWGYVSGSRDGKRFIGLDNGSLLFFDVQVSNQPRVLLSGLKDCYVTALSPSGDFAAAGDGKDAVVVDTRSGNVITRFRADGQFSSGPTELAFSDDGRQLVAAFIGNIVRVLQLSSGKITATATFDRYESISISPDSKTILIGDTERDNLTVDYRSLDNLRLISRLRIPGRNSTLKPANFDPTGRLAIVGSFDGSLRLFDLNSGAIIRTFQGHTGPIGEARFVFSGKRIVSTASDGLKMWDTSTGELLATYVISRDSQWLAITPEGFFDASPDGAKTLSIVRGLDVFSIDQFYDSLHRPDLLQQKLAGDPQGKVRAAGLQLSLPRAVASGKAPAVKIISPISHITTSDLHMVVEAGVADQGGGIGKVEWRVNGATMGVSRQALVKDGRAVYQKTVDLIAGKNEIEVVAYNSEGLISSDPATTIISMQQQQDYGPPQLHVLAVGVNDYWDSKLRLNFAVPDARSISDGLKEAGKTLYDKVDITTILDADVNVGRLDRAFDQLSHSVHPQDVFVFFMSGHGKTVDGRFYFIPQDFRYSNEDSITQSGINQDQLQRWFAKIPAQKSVLLFDACESGALIGDRIAMRGMEDKTAIDLMSRAVGRTVLTATTDDKPAAEGYRGHGVFTYAILMALAGADANNDGVIDILELANFVDKEVPVLTYDAWKMRQVPQMKVVGSNFPLVSRTSLLVPGSEPAFIPVSPTHVVITATIIRQSGDVNSPVILDLTAGAQIRVLEVAGDLALVARDGKKLGYVAVKALAPLH